MGKVLVIRGGALGDFVLTLPSIALLRADLPDPRVEVLGYKPYAELAIAAGLADAARSIEHGPLAGFFAPGTELDPEWSAYFAGFDLVVSHLHDPEGHFIANLERAGVRDPVQALAKVDPATGEHAARQLARALEGIGLFLDDPAPSLRFAGANFETELEAARGRVAIHPGSGGAMKNWHLERWIQLGAELGVPLLLVTGEAEETKREAVARAWATAGIDVLHADSWPLTRLAAALSGCRAFLGHDSGVSHLAAAAGCPCTLLFGPTDPAVWAPANPGVQVVQSPTEAIADIPYDEVLKAARAAL